MTTFSTLGAAEAHLIAEGYRWVGPYWRNRIGMIAVVAWSKPGYQITIGHPPGDEDEQSVA